MHSPTGLWTPLAVTDALKAPRACRLPRSWPLFDHTADAWGAAQSALQALWPPDGRGVSWALLFVALLALAGLYEGAVFLTERLWGVRPSGGLRSKEGGGKQEHRALVVCIYCCGGARSWAVLIGRAAGGCHRGHLAATSFPHVWRAPCA